MPLGKSDPYPFPNPIPRLFLSSVSSLTLGFQGKEERESTPKPQPLPGPLSVLSEPSCYKYNLEMGAMGERAQVGASSWQS